MPITIQNSAGGGVTLDSTTSSNETLQLPSGGGTLAPLASPSFTGTVSANKGSAGTLANFTDGVNTDFIVKTTSLVATAGPNAGSTSLALQTAGSERMRIDSSGRVLVGITGASGFASLESNDLAITGNCILARASGSVLVGTTSSIGSNTAKLEILGGSGGGRCINTKTAVTTSANALSFHNGNGQVGSISTNGSATAYNTSSDYRLKENVTPMSGATAHTKLLKPCNFDWIIGGNVNGFIAHELAEVVPEAVTGTKDAMMDEEYEVTPATDTEAAVMGTRSVPDLQGIDQSKLVPLLTATIQELIARIEALENV